VPLFIGIYQDLFPHVEVPAFERSDLIECLIFDIKRRNLQPTPWFLEKCMQIYEMILVRHGLMIVGKPMGGKTCAYQVSLTRIVAKSSRLFFTVFSRWTRSIVVQGGLQTDRERGNLQDYQSESHFNGSVVRTIRSSFARMVGWGFGKYFQVFAVVWLIYRFKR